MNLMTEVSALKTTRGRFDQTAPHIHVEDTFCPTCLANATYREPTILEQRMQRMHELEEDLRRRDERIKAFEQFTASFAAHIDGMRQAVEQALAPRAEHPRAAGSN